MGLIAKGIGWDLVWGRRKVAVVARPRATQGQLDYCAFDWTRGLRVAKREDVGA